MCMKSESMHARLRKTQRASCDVRMTERHVLWGFCYFIVRGDQTRRARVQRRQGALVQYCGATGGNRQRKTAERACECQATCLTIYMARASFVPSSRGNLHDRIRSIYYEILRLYHQHTEVALKVGSRTTVAYSTRKFSSIYKL